MVTIRRTNQMNSVTQIRFWQLLPAKVYSINRLTGAVLMLPQPPTLWSVYSLHAKERWQITVVLWNPLHWILMKSNCDFWLRDAEIWIDSAMRKAADATRTRRLQQRNNVFITPISSLSTDDGEDVRMTCTRCSVWLVVICNIAIYCNNWYCM